MATATTVGERVERFAAALERAAGDNLASMVLYGSAASGTERENSDVNLLVILRDAGAAALRAVAPAVREWSKEGERPPLIFGQANWQAAADVFPLEIEDIRARHRVIRGTDPVADLATAPADRRRELEREARGKMVQLRAAYAATLNDGKALGGLIAASLRGLLPLFRATVRLAGKEPAHAPADTVGQVADLATLDRAAFTWPLGRLHGGKETLTADDPRAARYVDQVAAFVDYVDRLTP